MCSNGFSPGGVQNGHQFSHSVRIRASLGETPAAADIANTFCVRALNNRTPCKSGLPPNGFRRERSSRGAQFRRAFHLRYLKAKHPDQMAGVFRFVLDFQ